MAKPSKKDPRKVVLEQASSLASAAEDVIHATPMTLSARITQMASALHGYNEAVFTAASQKWHIDQPKAKAKKKK